MQPSINMKNLTKLLLAITSILILTSCADLNSSNYPYGRGSGGYYNDGGYYEGSSNYEERRRLERERQRAYDERRRLEEERQRAEEERQRLERERDRRGHNYGNHHSEPLTPPVVERCPSGFSPSERKCSSKERKRGCKDMRLPGGLGCVKR